MADPTLDDAGPGGPKPPEPRPAGLDRPWVRALGWGVWLLVAVILLLAVQILAARHHARFDWTGSGLYSLSETTEAVLDELDREVEVVSFLPVGSRLHEPVRELLERYAARSSRLTVRWVDPERQPLEAERLAGELGTEASGVLFLSGDARRAVAAADLADLDYGGYRGGLGGEPPIAAFRGEERFTSALVALVQGERPRVLFTVGHGERSLDDLSGDGLLGAQDLLDPENVDLSEWRSLSGSGEGAAPVPEGVDLVVVAGPQAPFLPAELARFDRFLAAGGRMLWLLDPVLAPGGIEAGFADLGLADWLSGYGVDLGRDLVVDPAAALPSFGPETLYAGDWSRHPVSEPLARGSLPILVREARSVGVLTGAPSHLRLDELLRTTGEGWAIGRLDRAPTRGPGEGDRTGPVPLAVVVEELGPPGGSDGGPDGPGPSEADGEASGEAAGEAVAESGPGMAAERAPTEDGFRLAVVGDSDFASTTFLASGTGNAVFLNNLFNWLLERDALMGIPPKRPEQVRLTLTRRQLLGAVVLVLLVLPGTVLALGLWVWRRRRRP